MQVIPTGSNAFSASAPAFCYFEVYTPGATESATVGLRILDAQTGAQKWDGGSAKLNPPIPGKFTIPVGLGVPARYSASRCSTSRPASVAYCWWWQSVLIVCCLPIRRILHRLRLAADGSGYRPRG